MGLAVEEFWALTPREMRLVFEARAEQARLAHRQRAWLAWHVAALTRAKRMPPLARLIPAPPARKLTAEEKERRAREFEEMKQRMAATDSATDSGTD